MLDLVTLQSLSVRTILLTVCKLPQMSIPQRGSVFWKSKYVRAVPYLESRCLVLIHMVEQQISKCN